MAAMTRTARAAIIDPQETRACRSRAITTPPRTSVARSANNCRQRDPGGFRLRASAVAPASMATARGVVSSTRSGKCE